MNTAHAAIDALVRAHAGQLRAMCQRLLGDTALAEDAVQNAFIQALLGWSGFQGRSDAFAWLRRITVRCAIAVLRERGRWSTEEPSEADLEVAPEQWPCALQDQQLLVAALRQALTTLTERERVAFVLRHVEQFDIEEVAEHLGCNVNNCRQTAFRGAQKIRQQLAAWRRTE